MSRVYEHRATAHIYPGMLCAGQSFLHLEDLADAVARLIERRDRLPTKLPLLVGEPEAIGYAEGQNIIGEALHGEDWTTIRVPETLALAGSWLQNEVWEMINSSSPGWWSSQARTMYSIYRARGSCWIGSLNIHCDRHC